MQNELKIALIQSDLVWENPDENRRRFTDKINDMTEPVDLIVLPEMFTSGFTMNAKGVAETMTGTTVLWMQELAKQNKAAITGSMVIKEGNRYYNRLLFVHPDGKIDTYNKRHTFTLAGEHHVYQTGENHTIITYKGWSIKPLICYDLRFPVWARNVEDYDLLLYVANWPKVRISAWDALLKARAIENMSYCIGVNRVGLDFNNHEYSGHSAAYDVLGKQIDTIPYDKEVIEIVTLDMAHIKANRDKLGFLNDRDDFNLE
ncbi:Carbon-nitrogen hydrolase [Formosa sp. Hel1_31_208]|uniref:amidohydrolase n=1 Tax=Formosa sp. Hel1_31_208 TaxID=1798225 RepID=UPI00087C73AB|nr:amidohydrolase [Formosa sp. Hel1_31_208]SDR81997.1 Carbon-nitrogen hydrolase [Formosa sp. Hel1_31_208]